MHPVLLQLHLEAAVPPPTGVLPAVVGQHLLGHAILRQCAAVQLEHVLGGLATVQPQTGHEAAVVVDVTDEVGVGASQTEGENVRLPHLVGSGAFEETRTGQVVARLGPGRLAPRPMLCQPQPDRLVAARQKEQSLEKR
jgi:hypothetical protein